MNVQFTDNSKEVSDNIKAALLRGLETCGLVAEGYAKKLAPVDTGNLRNSITHEVDDGEYQAEGNSKANELTTLIANAKATIREQYPDEN